MNQYVSQGVFDRRVKLIEEKLRHISDNDLLNRLQAEQEEFIKRLKEIELDGSIPDYFIADYNAFKANTLRIDDVYDANGQFDGSKIKPLSISTAALTVGQRSQQLSLTGVEFSVTPYSHSGGYYGTLEWSGGLMFHYGFINENSEPKVYTITSGSFALGNYAYYIYAYIANLESITTTAEIKVSTNQIKVDGEGKPFDFPNGYYVQLGYVSIELDSGSSESTNRYYRKVDTTYGQTTINGRLITTGRIEGSSGANYVYFDLDKGEIGGTIKFTSGNEELDIDDYLETKYADIYEYVFEGIGNPNEGIKDYIDSIKSYLEDQIDGVVDSYFMEGVPTLLTTKKPISDWYVDGTINYNNHNGDTYTDILKNDFDLSEVKNNLPLWIEQGGLLIGTNHYNKTFDIQEYDSQIYCRLKGILSFNEGDTISAPPSNISMIIIYYNNKLEYITNKAWTTSSYTFTSSDVSNYKYFTIVFRATNDYSTTPISPSDFINNNVCLMSSTGNIKYPFSGHSWRFVYENNTPQWLVISDSEVAKALQLAAEAQDTADGKRRVFITNNNVLPTPPYDEGDLWTNATYGTYDNCLLRCKTSKVIGATADISDWCDSNRAIAEVDNVTNDGIISKGSEKSSLKKEWEEIVSTYSNIINAITTFNVSSDVTTEKTNLDTAYNRLNAVMKVILGYSGSNINDSLLNEDTYIGAKYKGSYTRYTISSSNTITTSTITNPSESERYDIRIVSTNTNSQNFRDLWKTYYEKEAILNDAIQKAAQDKIETGVDAAKAELLAIENGTTTIAGGMITNNLLELKNIVGVSKQFKNYVSGRQYYRRISNVTSEGSTIARFLTVSTDSTYPNYNLYEEAEQGDVNTISGIAVSSESQTTGTSKIFKGTEFYYGGGTPGFVTAGLSGIEDFPCYWSGGDEVLARDYIRFKKAWLDAPNTTSGSSYINYVWQNSDLDFIYDWTESTGQGIGTYPIWKKNSSGNVLKANFATSIVRYYIYKREGTRFVTPYDTTPIDTDNDIPRLPVVIIDFDGFCKFGEFCIYNSQAYYNNASGFGHYALSLNGSTNGSGTSLGSFYAPIDVGDNGQFLRSNGSGSPSWTNITKSNIGLGNVENIALSTWNGTSNITTLGTISSGNWNGTKIGVGYGGTNNTSFSASRLIYSNTAYQLSSSNITSNGNYLGNVSYLSVNNAHQTNYRLYVNGSARVDNLRIGDALIEWENGGLHISYVGNTNGGKAGIYADWVSALGANSGSGGGGGDINYADLWNELTSATSEHYVGNTTINTTHLPLGYTQNNQNYPVQSSSGSLFVNVPWTDNNTTYKLSLNGTQYGGGSTSLGSFYAPTSAGTSGYILKSNGSGAPSWVAQSNLSVGSASKLTTARKTYVTLDTASTTTTRDWSGDTTIPVSGILSIANGGTGSSNLDKFRLLEKGTLISATSSNQKDFNDYTNIGTYYSAGSYSNSTTMNNMLNKPSGVVAGFKLIVEHLDNNTSSDGYLKQTLYIKDKTSYTRTRYYSSDEFIWTNWVKNITSLDLGSQNRIVKFGSNTFANSIIYENNDKIGIRNSAPDCLLTVNGDARISNSLIIGSLSNGAKISWDSINGGLKIEHVVSGSTAGVYADWVSALGANDQQGGSGGGMDITTLWKELTNDDDWSEGTKAVAVSRGGTGLTSLTSGYALIGNGTSAVSLRAITNNTSASAVTASTNLITANTLYYHKGNSNIVNVGTITSGTWNGTTIGAAYGGTGKTNLKDACNALINALDIGNSVLTSNDYVITQYVGGGTTTKTYHRRPASAVRVGGLLTGRKLKVALGSTTDVTFNGTADVTNIPISGTLAVGNGGTGATSAVAAEYNILGSIQTVETEPNDDRYIALRNQTVNDVNGTFRWTKMTSVWDYLKGKMSSDSAVNISGNAATATKLASSVTLWGQSFDGSSNVSGNITNAGNITSSSTNTKTLGSSSNIWSSVYAKKYYADGTNSGYYANGKPAIYHNGSNLWIGSETTDTNVFTGGLYLNAGNTTDGYRRQKAYLCVGDTATSTTGSNRVIVNGSGGSATQPVYIDSLGRPTSTTYSLSSTINAGTANRLAYYTSDGIDDASTTYVSNTKLAINSTSEPSDNFYVNGTSCFNSTTKVTSTGTNRATFELISNGDYPVDLKLGRSDTAKWSLTSRNDSEGDAFYLYSYVQQASAIYVKNDNTLRVGIGTNTPNSDCKLHVVGNIYATGGVTALQDVSSDKRLKKNIKKFNAKDIIDKLNPVSFEWNNKAKKLSDFKDGINYGLIAQNSDGIIDNLVFDLPDGKGYKGVRYEKLIPILLQAVKEQQKEIDELKSIVKQLKNK